MTQICKRSSTIGNTNIVLMNPGEADWSFTINNYVDRDISFLEGLEAKLMIVSKEVSASGTPHLQGRVIFKRIYRETQLKKLHPRAHWERTSQKSDSNYILKVDSEVCINYDKRCQGKRSDLDAILAEISETPTIKEFADKHMSTYVRYRNGIESLFAMKEEPRMFKPQVIWIYGKSGTGKTSSIFAAHDAKDIWMAPNELNFFLNYDNQKVAVFDDFRAGRLKFTDLLRLIDRYPYTCNVKGGHRQFNSSIIYFTSIKKPSEIYSFGEEEEPLEQLTRRITEIRHLE